jgi:hypothetical protein
MIDFDKIINHKINRTYVLNLFYKKQNLKKRSLYRFALQNQTVQNLHKIYDISILNYLSSPKKTSFYTEDFIENPLELLNSHDTSFCFICDE